MSASQLSITLPTALPATVPGVTAPSMDPVTEQHPLTDFFDQKVQKTTGKNNRTIYKMNNETGEGIITQYIILPGIQFFYNDFHMSNGQNQNKLPHADVLELNHCREGRFECRFANGTYQYIGSGDLAINLLSNQTVSTSFPLFHYHGISITIFAKAVGNGKQINVQSACHLADFSDDRVCFL